MEEAEAFLVNRVSDTALWAAAYRALESRNPEPLFQDPFAEQLAGEKGRGIVEKLRGGEKNAFSFSIRTRFFDDAIREVIEKEGLDSVLNLGSGLDTRPYRLKLPADLKWFDVDLPEIISYMQEKMRSSKPLCQLERLSWDINDESSRRQLFSKINQTSRKTLIVSEGVITYFTSQQVDLLVKDLNEAPCFRFWLHDFYSRKVILRLQQEWKKQFSPEALFQFDPEDWFGFFESRGWRALKWITVIEEAKLLNRKLPPAWVVWKWLSRMGIIREKVPSGYVLLERTGSR
jgi:methyltransferase (TIGR00027 family)